MRWPLTDWQIGLSSPQRALEWVDAYVAYGRPAQALELIQAANQKFPEHPKLMSALEYVKSLNQDEVAARNGPSLPFMIFAGGLLIVAGRFAVTGLLEAPLPVKLICGLLLVLLGVGLYAVVKHVIVRWQIRS